MLNKILVTILIIFSHVNISKSQNVEVSNNFPPIVSSSGIMEYSPMGIHTIYDLQCYGSPQTIWQDPNNPANVHAVFVHTYGTTITPRHVAYFFSSNGGVDWVSRGDVPNIGAAHFPSISGFDNGIEILSINISPGVTGIFIDSVPGAGRFNVFIPENGDGLTRGKIVGIGNNKIVFSTSGSAFSQTNTFTYTPPTGTFSGFVEFDSQSSQREALAKSSSGIIGQVYVGSVNVGGDKFKGFFTNSTDSGVTWATSQTIWNWNISDSLGCLRGNSIIYLDETPVVAFETAPQVSSFTIYPDLPSQIRVWSPAVNGGVPVIAADSGIIPFYPDKNRPLNDWDYVPVCRPSIGKSSSGDVLILSFSATTEDYAYDIAAGDTNSYYASWIAFSTDGGASWFNHQKITPELPLRDWRFQSISPTNNVSGNQLTAQMVCVADTAAGISSFGASTGDAELVGIRLPQILIQVFRFHLGRFLPVIIKVQPRLLRQSTGLMFRMLLHTEFLLR